MSISLSEEFLWYNLWLLRILLTVKKLCVEVFKTTFISLYHRSTYASKTKPKNFPIFKIWENHQNLVGRGLCLLRKECIVLGIMKIIRACNMQRIKF